MATVTAPPADPVRLWPKLLEAADVPIEPVPLSGLYRFGLVVVAAAMLLLPALYLGLTLLLASAVYWHAVHGQVLLRDGGFWGTVTYLGGLVVGPIVVLFLVKPLFARQGAAQAPRRLKREAEPFLYDYVERVADAVGAPRPRSIRVNCDVNASAGFRRGVLSMFGHDLTLTIGLPLAAGLNLRQFTGVLAHEFGHFSQGAGMRLTYLIRSINFWFVRVVYERDSWDEWLENASRGVDLRIGVFLYAARFFVWLTRRAMWGIMWLGHLISGFMLRQMEYDADRYEARLAGARAFASTAWRLNELMLAHQMAIGDLQQFWDEGRLADDLPRLIVANIPQITPALRRELKKRVKEAETGLLDTHPTDRDRVASVKAENAPGVLRLPAKDDAFPATILFGNFDRLSRHVSLEFYRDVLGPEIKADVLHPVDALIERQTAEIEAAKALHRYFQVRIPALRPLPLAPDAIEPPADPKVTAMFLKAARQKMLAALPEYLKLGARYGKAEESLFDAAGALALLQAKLRVKAGDFNLKKATVEAAGERSRQSRTALQTLATRMLPFEEHGGDRLCAALRLLQVPRVAERIEGGSALRREAGLLVPEALFVSGLMQEATDLRLLFVGLMHLCARLEGNEQNARLIEAIRGKMESIRTRLTTLSARLGEHLYPFDHARADMTLREYALPTVPEEDDLGGVLAATEQLFDKLVTVQIRLFARLAHAAEKVETALGLPLLPEREEDDEEDRMAESE